MTDFSLAGIYANAPVAHDDGHFINAKVSRIVELIREHDPNLDVKWIPPNQRGHNDPAFVIVERAADGGEYPVFHVDSEEHMNEEVLTAVYAADMNIHNVQDWLEAKNKAYRDAQALQARDEMEAKHDLARSILKSPLHTYKHNGKTIRR